MKFRQMLSVIGCSLIFALLGDLSALADLGRADSRFTSTREGPRNYCVELANQIRGRSHATSSSRVASLQELESLIAGPAPFEASAIFSGHESSMQGVALTNGELSDEDLTYWKIPKGMWPFYNRHTGEFRYVPTAVHHLALENGDAKLRAVRIHLANNNSSEISLSEALVKDYMAVMDRLPSVELWFVYPKDLQTQAQNLVGAMPKSLRNRIRMVENTRFATLFPWAQDGSKPMEDANILMPSQVMAGRKDAYFAPIYGLQDQGLSNTKETPFYFEGGNIVVGHDHIFVGSYIIKKNMMQFRATRQEIVEALFQEFGRPVIEVGVPLLKHEMLQINFHIDLTLAAIRDHKTGREVIILENTRELFKLLELNIDQLNDQTFYVELANAIERYRAKETKDGTRLLTHNERQFLSHLAELDYFEILYRIRQADFVKKQLESQGLTVMTMPGATLIITRSTRNLDVYNYTNSIFSGTHALIPQLGIEILDRHARSIYESLGYETIGMRSAGQSFCLSGGPRCLTETYRLPAP